MAHEKSYYTIKSRTEGIKPAALRRSGLVPGVIYGGRLEGGQPFEIERSELMKLLKDNTKSSVIDMDYDGSRGSVIVREVQRDPSSGEIIHLDLQAIRKDEVLTLDVTLQILGEDELAGRRLIVNQNMDKIQVKGPADKIPESVTIDLTGKGPDDKMEAGDIELPEGVEMLTSEDELLVTISESKTSQDLEATEEAAETAAETAEVPVVDEEPEAKE